MSDDFAGPKSQIGLQAHPAPGVSKILETNLIELLAKVEEKHPERHYRFEDAGGQVRIHVKTDGKDEVDVIDLPVRLGDKMLYTMTDFILHELER